MSLFTLPAFPIEGERLFTVASMSCDMQRQKKNDKFFWPQLEREQFFDYIDPHIMKTS